MPYPSTHVEWIFVWSRKIVEFKKVFNAVVWFFGGSIILQSDNFPLCQSLTKANSVFTFKCLVYSTDLNFHPTQQWFKFTTSGAQATDKSPEFAQRGLLKLQINPPLIIINYHWLFRNNNYLLLIPIRNAYRYVPLRKLPYSEPYFLKREHLYLNLQRNYS